MAPATTVEANACRRMRGAVRQQGSGPVQDRPGLAWMNWDR
ncbi:hypothetical protein WQQ_10680 [Hydrocarboniphaga effusa AP103]|uniref:Uncharacterized protein n=1 Tax=Hydrocarboniphaga effusa AP103 TaxID=1172194 RepID=I8I446_9GAMM|nr:hypothetical protein WQQ_10680 [Hydrocarboniphaga effusa AP103]